MTLDLKNFYHNSKCHTLLINQNLSIKCETVLPILNSKLFWFYISNTGNILREGYIGIKRKALEPFPIPSLKEIELKQNELDAFTASMIKSNNEIQIVKSKFLRLLNRKFSLTTYSKNIQNWYNLNFDEFTKELTKKKIRLSLSEESEWEEYFEEEKAKAHEIKSIIDNTDKHIDQMVYELYGLSKEEIEIVEQNTN